MKVRVTMMLENIHDTHFYSACSLTNINKGWNASLKWLLASHGIHTFAEPCKKKASPSKSGLLLAPDPHIHMMEAKKGIAQIKDPLWRRVCADILKVLGPVAFKDLWNTQLKSISPDGKRAFLTCSTQAIAITLEEYHFVIIGALKEFYPFLSSIEIECHHPTFETKKKNESAPLTQNCLRATA